MTRPQMTPMQRVMATVARGEPDRVPLFLLTTTHGARELGVSIKEYFSRPEYVVEGQLRMLARYRHDCVSGIFFACIEVEAWGSEVIYVDDGPPNSGAPFLRDFGQIATLRPPRIDQASCLRKVLAAIHELKARVGDSVPVIGLVISPFSLPVMQMGFDSYIELIYEQRSIFHSLMRVNEQFCADWANAQLAAGATAICYFDPVSSPTMVPRELYLETGFPVAARTLARINGPTAIHLGSAPGLPILNDLARTDAVIYGASALEDLAETKKACSGRLCVLGNLNAIDMRRWTSDQAETAVKTAISKAGPGGGFILSDNHGEIPWQVPEEVLMSVSDAVHRWGRYPLDWVGRHDG